MLLEDRIVVYSGIVKYEGADIAFQFDELKLSLYPTNEIFNKITMHKIDNTLCYTYEKSLFPTAVWTEKLMDSRFLFISFSIQLTTEHQERILSNAKSPFMSKSLQNITVTFLSLLKMLCYNLARGISIVFLGLIPQ